MANKLNLSTKRLLVDRANTVVFGAVAAAAFVSIFAIVASKALLNQRAYQNRVIGGKQEALNQLKADLTATNSLVSSYKAFVGTNPNVIGGDANGSSDRDGDNAKIILDALPSKYDFPALTTSLQKILTANNNKVDSINGSDDQIAQQKNLSSATPIPVVMPFQTSVQGSYASIQNLIDEFQHSVRPFQFTSLSLSGNQGNMRLDIAAQTYFQPGKSLNIKTKVIK